jgi:hypothetical protein
VWGISAAGMAKSDLTETFTQCRHTWVGLRRFLDKALEVDGIWRGLFSLINSLSSGEMLTTQQFRGSSCA